MVIVIGLVNLNVSVKCGIEEIENRFHVVIRKQIIILCILTLYQICQS